MYICTLYTSDLPRSQYTYTATFADDTTVMTTVNKNPDIACSVLQQSLNERQECMKLFRIVANENKSANITALKFLQTTVLFFKLLW